MAVKWCVIGAGGIADRRMIPAILSSEKCELVAVMDRVPAVAEAVGKKYGVPFFTDEDEMLSAVQCDAVYIGTPVFCHYPQAMTALKYGKHALIEKPIALDAEQGSKLVQLFKSGLKHVEIGYMMKNHNLHEMAKTIIQGGGIGQVNTVRAQFSCWYPDIDGAWRQSKALGGGGAVMDLGVHCIELIEYLLDDEIEDVKAITSTRTFSYEVEDGAVIIFQTKGGVLGHVDVNFNIPDMASESKLELYGSEGYVICRGTLSQEESGVMHHLHSPQGDYSAAQSRTTCKPVTHVSGGANLYQKQIELFCDKIESGEYDYFYADRAVQVQSIIDKIYAGEKEE